MLLFGYCFVGFLWGDFFFFLVRGILLLYWVFACFWRKNITVGRVGSGGGSRSAWERARV